MCRLAALLIAFLLHASASAACTCGEGSSPNESYGPAQMVFAGHVTRIARHEVNGYDVEIRILHAWKGTDADVVHLRTADSGMCGYTFRTGRSYIVFAYVSRPMDAPPSPEPPVAQVSMCSGTVALEDGFETLRFLDTLKEPEAEPELDDLRSRATAYSLLSTVLRGDIEKVRESLRAGVDPDAADGAGRTALMTAMRLKQPQPMVQLLLDAGADPARTDRAGRCAFYYAGLYNKPMRDLLSTVKDPVPCAPSPD